MPPCDSIPKPSSDPIDANGALVLPERLTKLQQEHRLRPSEPTIQKELADELYTFGLVVLCKSDAMPRVKYPHALRIFRAVRNLDESNSDAKEAAELIESIYKAMGRPVPE